jgi:hypothetical protein
MIRLPAGIRLVQPAKEGGNTQFAAGKFAKRSGNGQMHLAVSEGFSQDWDVILGYRCRE